MLTDLWRHLNYDSRENSIQCMPCSPRSISEVLPEIHTMEKYDFPKPKIHSQIIQLCFKFTVRTVSLVFKEYRLNIGQLVLGRMAIISGKITFLPPFIIGTNS